MTPPDLDPDALEKATELMLGLARLSSFYDPLEHPDMPRQMAAIAISHNARQGQADDLLAGVW